MIEVGMIQGIEAFGAKLHLHFLGQLKVLRHAEVCVPISGATEYVAAESSTARWRHFEAGSCGIEHVGHKRRREDIRSNRRTRLKRCRGHRSRQVRARLV